jgi:hypothetical protein
MMVKTEEHTPTKKGHQNSYPYDSSILASFIINHNLDIKKREKELNKMDVNLFSLQNITC